MTGLLKHYNMLMRYVCKHLKGCNPNIYLGYSIYKCCHFIKVLLSIVKLNGFNTSSLIALIP